MNIKTIIEKYTDRAKEYIMARGSPLIEALNDCMHNLIRNASVESPHYTIKANPISFTTIVKYVGEITDGRENQRALEDGVIFSEKHCAIIVTGASGSQRAKFDRLQTTIRNNNAAMGILITLNTQNARRNWKHTLEPIQMGETRYDPIQCFSIEEYYEQGERWEPLLKLPALANPWTGKEIQETLFDKIKNA